MSGSNYCFLTCIQISQEAGKVVWYSHLLKSFPQFIVIYTVKDFGIIYKAEVDFFFFFILLLFLWSNGCWQLDHWYLCLFKIQLEHLEIHGSRTVKAWLENFEHYFASVWDEGNRAIVQTFFGIALLWDWNENWPFLVLNTIKVMKNKHWETATDHRSLNSHKKCNVESWTGSWSRERRLVANLPNISLEFVSWLL